MVTLKRECIRTPEPPVRSRCPASSKGIGSSDGAEPKHRGNPSHGDLQPQSKREDSGQKSRAPSDPIFLLVGRTRYKGTLITHYIQFASFFERSVIYAVREDISHLRCYWSSLDGSIPTIDQHVSQMVSYREDVDRNLAVQRASSRPTDISQEEPEALEHQILTCRR